MSHRYDLQPCFGLTLIVIVTQVEYILTCRTETNSSTLAPPHNVMFFTPGRPNCRMRSARLIVLYSLRLPYSICAYRVQLRLHQEESLVVSR